MNTTLTNLMHEALQYEAEAFDADTDVNGADLVEWFAQWRVRAKIALRKQESSISPSEPDRVAKSKRQPACSACGSVNVCADAAARWNVDAQEWEVSNIFDKGHGCDDCDCSDIEFVWVEVQ